MFAQRVAYSTSAVSPGSVIERCDHASTRCNRAIECHFRVVNEDAQHAGGVRPVGLGVEGEQYRVTDSNLGVPDATVLGGNTREFVTVEGGGNEVEQASGVSAHQPRLNRRVALGCIRGHRALLCLAGVRFVFTVAPATDISGGGHLLVVLARARVNREVSLHAVRHYEERKPEDRECVLGQQSSGRGEQASATSTVDDMKIPWDTGAAPPGGPGQQPGHLLAAPQLLGVVSSRPVRTPRPPCLARGRVGLCHSPEMPEGGLAVIRVEASIDIGRSAKDVFAYVGDQTNAPRWQRGLADVRRTTDARLVSGPDTLRCARSWGAG
jgi:hypothetical protein